MRINEIFYSTQGEGVRAGTANVFVRFAGCNLQCDIEPGPLSPGGFACDTEFAGGRELSPKAVVDEAIASLGGAEPSGVIFTGGEPALQLTPVLVELFREAGFYTAIETNGTVAVSPLGLDWITCSPKVAEHAIKIVRASELKYVRHAGQALPKPRIDADYYLLSPAWGTEGVDVAALAWCVRLVKENPSWRLSLQLHKWIGVR